MNRRTLLLGTIAATYVTLSRADSWSVVSDEEFRQASKPEAAAAAKRGAPIIMVDQPDESEPVKSPVSIRISFHPQDNTTINLSSLRVTYYGFLDITDRIIGHAR